MSSANDYDKALSGAEEKIMQSGLTYRAFFENNMDAIVCIDVHGKVFAWNSQSEKIFGWRSQEIIGEHIEDTVIPFYYQDKHREGMAHYLATGEGPILNKLVEVIAVDKAGRQFPVELTVIPLVENNQRFFCAFIRDISERKTAEKETRENEEKYRSFFENSLDGILLASLDGKIFAANPAACEMFGMTEEELCLVGRKGIVDSSSAELPSILKTRELTGQVKGELVCLKKDGTRFPVEISSAVFTDAQGEVRTTMIIRDITERKRTEEVIKRSEEKLLASIENTPNVAVQWYNRKGEVLFWNHASELIFGWKAEEALGKTLDQLIHTPEEAAGFLKALRQIEQTGHTIGPAEFSFHHRSGSHGYCISTIFSIPSDREPCFVCMDVDITERKNAEQLIQKSEEKYRAIIEQASDAIMITDTKGNFIDVNAAFCKKFGYSKEECLQQNISSVIDPGQLKNEPIRFDLLMKGESVLRERKMMHRNGTIIEVEANVKMMPDGNLLAIARDITERKKTETELRQSKNHLRNILSSSADDFYVINKDYRVTLINEGAVANLKKAWGKSVEIGSFILDLIPAEKIESIRKNYDKTFRGERVDYEISQAAGEVQEWKKVSYMPVNDENGIVTGILVVTKDITFRKRAEEELEKSISVLEATLESTADGLLVVDEGGKVVRFNKKFVELWNIPESVLVTKDDDKAIEFVLNQLKNPETFLLKVKELYACPEAVSFDVLDFIDGRTFERYSQPHVINGKSVGRVWSFRDVSERKRAEETIRRSNERFELISRTTNDAVWEWNLETNELWANETHQQLYGLTVHDPVPTSDMWEDRIHPDDRERLIQLQAETLASDSNIFISEYRFKTEKQGYRTIYDRSYIIRDDSGKPIRIMGSMMDITERKKMEDSLRESEERYRSLVDNAVEALVVLDMQEGKFVNVSESAVRFFKMSKEELLKIGPLEVSPEFQPGGRLSSQVAIEKINLAIAGQKPNFEWVHIDAEGKNIPCEIRLVRLPSETKTLIRGSIVDISERKKAEAAIKESETRLRTIFETEPECIKLLNSKGELLDMNPAGLAMIEADNLEMVKGRSVSGIVAPDYREAFNNITQQVFNGETVTLEFEIIGLKGTHRWLETHAVPMRDSSGNIIALLGVTRNITERKKAEQAVKESEEKYRTLVEQASDPILIYSLDGRILDYNNAFMIATGYEKKDVENLELADLLFETDLKDNPLLFGLIKKGLSVHDERRARRKDGSVLPVELNSKMMPDGNVMVIARDISERKKAEQQLKESEEKYRTLVEQAVDAIALYDEKGKILDVNTGSVNLLGYTKEELIQMHLSDVLTADELESMPVRYDVLQKGESTVKQRLMRRKDGSLVQTEVRSQQLPDGRFLSVIRDLTERVKAQEQIKREKELSDSVINSLPGLFYLIDETGKYIRWNKLKEEITGYSAKEMAQMNSLDFFEGKEKELVRQHINEGFAKGTTEVEAHIVTKTGKKILYYFTGIAIEYEGKRCLMGTGIDVSDRKKAEQELEQSYKAIRTLTEHLQNIREEERTHIAREIHDELGQQLTVMKMDISWINKKIGAQAEDNIKDKMKELMGMLDQTVKTVRRISSELRPSLLDDLGLAAAMEWQLHEFERRSGIRTNLNVPKDDIKLPDTVKTGIFRIFQESLTNVARHSNAKKVGVVVEQTKGSIVLSIIDDGKGFDKQKVEDKKTLGILGMKERTAMIGGSYEIISKPGKGTSVVVTIPLVPA